MAARKTKPDSGFYEQYRNQILSVAVKAVQLYGSRGFVEPALKELMERIPNFPVIRKQVFSTSVLNQFSEWKELKAEALEKHRQGMQDDEPDNPLIRSLERQLRAARDKSSLLSRKLTEADKYSNLVAEMINVVEQSWTPIEYVAMEPSIPDKDREAVDAVVLLSDEHGDRVVKGPATWGLERYNFDIFCERAYRWARAVTRYCGVHLAAKYQFDRLWVFKLGDSVNGDIHDAKYRNYFGNSIEAALAIGDVEAQMIAMIAAQDVFPEGIHVVCVPGNHGRQTRRKDYHDPHDNLDYLVAAVMRMRLQQYVDSGRVTITAPKAYTAWVNVRGHLCALNHGDDVIGTWGIPWYGFERKENRIQKLIARKDQSARYFFYGHYHTPMTRPSGGGRALHAGAWYMTDDYSINKLAVGDEPEQQLYVFSERWGRQMEIPIMLRNHEREDEVHRGERQPLFGRETVLTQLGRVDEVAELGEFPVIEANGL